MCDVTIRCDRVFAKPVDGDLASVLGTLRVRMTRRLSEAGIQWRWKVDDIPILAEFGPTRVLHVARIVYEAIANALRHSRAKQITLSARLEMCDSQSCVLIEVADDGLGFANSARSGRGLDNMRRRATDINAQLSVDSCARGTTVRLALPIDGATSNANLRSESVT